ncbi:hypothetical protein [Streptomyces sp. NPDC058401]|uniref:hypothetical protein n=1 Tax=Streptomyces sp. NPDC058401 TaxID=3346480 RepID=UPI0036563716
MAKKAHRSQHGHQDAHHDSEVVMAKNTAAEARAKAAVRDVQSISEKTRGKRQKSQAKRG